MFASDKDENRIAKCSDYTYMNSLITLICDLIVRATVYVETLRVLLFFVCVPPVCVSMAVLFIRSVSAGQRMMGFVVVRASNKRSVINATGCVLDWKTLRRRRQRRWHVTTGIWPTCSALVHGQAVGEFKVPSRILEGSEGRLSVGFLTNGIFFRMILASPGNVGRHIGVDGGNYCYSEFYCSKFLRMTPSFNRKNPPPSGRSPFGGGVET